MPQFSEVGWVYEGLLYIFVGIGVLIFSKYIKAALSPFKIDKELVHTDNAAVGVTLAGYYAGVIIIYLGAIIGETQNDLTPTETFIQLGIDLLYAVAGILALTCCRVIVDKTILYKFSTTKEIIEDRNIGTGAVECGSLIATALMIAGAIHGQGGVLSAVIFFLLGQLLLITFGWFHQLITPYDIHDEIEKDNVAAGAYMGFNMVALGVIILKATGGDFVSWQYNISYFFIYALIGFLALSILQKMATTVFLGGACIEEEIARDRNMNVAWVAGSMSIGLAALIHFML